MENVVQGSWKIQKYRLFDHFAPIHWYFIKFQLPKSKTGHPLNNVSNLPSMIVLTLLVIK